MSNKAPAPAPAPAPTPANEKQVFKAAIVNTTKMVEAHITDVADARMTASKEDRNKNWFKRKIDKIWKHDLMQEFYRQREISKVRKEIADTGNFYAGDKEIIDSNEAKEAMLAITDRFTDELRDEMLTKEEKDSIDENSRSSQEMNDLVRKYADTTHVMSDQAFEEEKKRIIANLDPTYKDKREVYADNILEIAKNVRQAVANGQKLEELDFDVDITLGSTRGRMQTAAHHNAFDKGVEKLQNSKLGKFLVNTPGAIALSAAVYSVGKYAFTKVARTDAAKIASFGGTAVISGTVAATKEAARLNRERAQHHREKAKGVTFEGDDMKRRNSMNTTSYETQKATEVTTLLAGDLAKVEAGNMQPADLDMIIAHIANLRARKSLGEDRHIDLVTYSSLKMMEKEGKELDKTEAKLVVALRKGVESGKIVFDKETDDFDTYLSQQIYTQERALLGGESGIEKKDQAFTKMKAKRTAWAFVKSATLGAGIGAVFQEAHALLSDDLDGVLEGMSKHLHQGTTGGFTEHATALEALRRHFNHEDVPRLADTGAGHEYLMNGGATTMHTPDGATVTVNPDGTYNIMRGNDVLEKNLPLEFDKTTGDLLPTSRALLQKDGIFANFSQTTQHGSGPMSAEDYIKSHNGDFTKVHRHTFYDNNTADKPDLNEKREYWGGENGTGVNAKGNYEFRTGVKAGGSFHGNDAFDVPEAIKKGGIVKMAFSVTRGTQHEVIMLPVSSVDEHGNAIFEIDKDSALGKDLFEVNADGHAVFKGQFAELIEDSGKAADGAENINIIATHIGLGQADTIVGGVDKVVPHLKLDIPGSWDYEMPMVVPILGRRPLESGKAPAKKKRPNEDPHGPADPNAPTPHGPDGVPLKAKDKLPPSKFTIRKFVGEKPEDKYSGLTQDLEVYEKARLAGGSEFSVNSKDLKSTGFKEILRKHAQVTKTPGSDEETYAVTLDARGKIADALYKANQAEVKRSNLKVQAMGHNPLLEDLDKYAHETMKPVSKEDFTKKYLPKLIQEAFRGYGNIEVPDNAFLSSKSRVLPANEFVGNLDIKVKPSKGSKKVDAKIDNLKFIMKDGKLEVAKGYTFTNPDETKDVRDTVNKVLTDFGSVFDKDLSGLFGEKLKSLKMNGGNVDVLTTKKV